MNIGTVRPQGKLGLKKIQPKKELPADSIKAILLDANPFAGEHTWEEKQWRMKNFHRLVKPMLKILTAKILGIPTIYGSLFLKVTKSNGNEVNYGLASFRVVTDVGVGFIVDAYQNVVEFETMNFHGIGTGSTAENQTDTDLVTELTTQYTSDNTRATGTTAENAANILESVATNSVDASVNLREHGLLSSATVGSGVLYDRTVFSSISLTSGDSLQSTYRCTFSAGG